MSKVCTACAISFPNNSDYFYLQSRSEKTRAACKSCARQKQRDLGWCATSVNVHKSNDKKDGLYSADKHITVEFLAEQYRKQEGRCMYPSCRCELSADYPRRARNSLTVERLSNWSGHWCENVVLICRKCQDKNKRTRRPYSDLIDLLDLNTPKITSKHEFKRHRHRQERRPCFI